MTLLQQPHNNAQFAHVVSKLPPINIHTGAWIAGGSARKIMENLAFDTGDVDVFFASDSQRLAWTAEFEDAFDVNKLTNDVSVDLFAVPSHAHNQISAEPKLKPYSRCYKSLETNNADTYELYFDDNGKFHSIKLQLIKARYSASVLELFAGFDFTVSCFAADADNIYFTAQSEQDLKMRQLRLNSTATPTNLALRVLKHQIYGFDVPTDLLIRTAELIAEGDFGWQDIY